jgi:hypothetical protein
MSYPVLPLHGLCTVQLHVVSTLIASFRYVSNAGFLIYVADSAGYLGSDAVLVLKNFLNVKLSWTEFLFS